MVSTQKIQLISIILILLSSACNRSDLAQYRTQRNSDSIVSTEKAIDVAIEYTELGKLKAILYSPLLTGKKTGDDPYAEMPKGIEVEFMDDKGQIESFLRAQYAISYDKSKRIIVRRNVDVMNLKGERFKTEELIWDQTTQKIHTDKPVWIFTQSQIIQGVGFESDQTFSRYSISNFIGTANVNNNDSLSRNRATLLSRRRHKRN